ncbi:hypothetical protein KAR91_05255 [Candidatus Pacearchaeota archaeon]|nr:hypothetical protein [Candidatus Pacearchaeota archaeon]
MSMFGSDFFKIIQFALAILRLFGRIFGDDEDKTNDKKAADNCATEIDHIVK